MNFFSGVLDCGRRCLGKADSPFESCHRRRARRRRQWWFRGPRLGLVRWALLRPTEKEREWYISKGDGGRDGGEFTMLTE